MDRGNRIFYYTNGEMIFQTGEATGDVLAHNENEVLYIDIPYGAIDHSEHRIVGVNAETKQPIIENIQKPTIEGE